MISTVKVTKEFIEKYENAGSPDNLGVIRKIIEECTNVDSQKEYLLKLVTLATDLNESILDPEQIVAVVHGIRTRAIWQGTIRDRLVDHGHKAYPLGYGYFDVLRFWCPFYFRNQVVEEIARELRVIQSKHPQKKITIIAHSFGTYITSKIIEEHTDININKLILAGSVITEKYRWDKNRLFEPGDVINECGLRDAWPVLANLFSWGYGATGTFGFKKALVHDRLHNVKHSDYLEIEFINKYWIPFIDKDVIVPVIAHQPPIGYSRWLLYLSKTPVKSLLLILAIILFIKYSY